MGKESIARLKSNLDMTAALTRLNTLLVEEWRSYRRRFSLDEIERARRRLLVDPDDSPQSCYPLC